MAQSFELVDEESTLALGAELASRVSEGMRIYLSGDLGAGKTTLTRGFLRSLGHEGAVKSPTYTLVEPYQGLTKALYHFDLYRLGAPEEIEYMGLRDYLDDSAIVIIEWPERGFPLLPGPDLAITIAIAGSGRRADLVAESVAGKECLHSLQAAFTKERFTKNRSA
ncbi:MAG: tRNA (adenosine(37)-N6)-threonylcarbamoyltransferase complex ATPase subunit type 1 TsaE [Pseudomonadota bacterium]